MVQGRLPVDAPAIRPGQYGRDQSEAHPGVPFLMKETQVDAPASRPGQYGRDQLPERADDR